MLIKSKKLSTLCTSVVVSPITDCTICGPIVTYRSNSILKCLIFIIIKDIEKKINLFKVVLFKLI